MANKNAVKSPVDKKQLLETELKALRDKDVSDYVTEKEKLMKKFDVSEIVEGEFSGGKIQTFIIAFKNEILK